MDLGALEVVEVGGQDEEVLEEEAGEPLVVSQLDHGQLQVDTKAT